MLWVPTLELRKGRQLFELADAEIQRLRFVLIDEFLRGFGAEFVKAEFARRDCGGRDFGVFIAGQDVQAAQTGGCPGYAA